MMRAQGAGSGLGSACSKRPCISRCPIAQAPLGRHAERVPVKAPSRRNSHIVADARGGGSGGGRGGPSPRTGGGDDSDGEGRPLVAPWALFASISGGLLVVAAALPPHADAAGDKDAPAGTSSDEIARLKRLQREAFAQLQELSAQVEKLAPKNDGGDDTIIPWDGAGVEPRPKHVGVGVRFRSKSQLTGSLETAAVLPWSQGNPDTAARDLRSLGLSVGPDCELLLQTLWPDGNQSLTARIGTTGTALPQELHSKTRPPSEPHPVPALSTRSSTGTDGNGSHADRIVPLSPGAAAVYAGGAHLTTLPTTPGGALKVAENGVQPSSAARGSAPGFAWRTARMPGNGLMQVRQLLLRKQIGSARLLVAPLGGSLESIARRLNPSASLNTGLTRSMRQGHDIPMATEAGSGIGATWVQGVLSASAGHFMSGEPARMRHHSVAQLSFHKGASLAASIVVSSTAEAGMRPPGAGPMVDFMSGFNKLRPMSLHGLLPPVEPALPLPPGALSTPQMAASAAAGYLQPYVPSTHHREPMMSPKAGGTMQGHSRRISRGPGGGGALASLPSGSAFGGGPFDNASFAQMPPPTNLESHAAMARTMSGMRSDPMKRSSSHGEMSYSSGANIVAGPVGGAGSQQQPALWQSPSVRGTLQMPTFGAPEDSVPRIISFKDGPIPSRQAEATTYAGVKGPARVGRLGVCGSAMLADALVVSAWRVSGPTGGGGLRLSTVPGRSGSTVAASVSRPCASHHRGGASTRWIHSPVAYELSTSVPVADGVMLTPGVVLARQEGRTTMALALSSTWRF